MQSRRHEEGPAHQWTWNSNPGAAGVGCIGLQLNFGTHARRALTQSRTEPKKLETTFSYDGWQLDIRRAVVCRPDVGVCFHLSIYAELAEERHIKYPPKPYVYVGRPIDTMLRKQQVHDGDRSHPIIRKLDALTPTLSYAGWEDDARKIEWPEAKSLDS